MSDLDPRPAASIALDESLLGREAIAFALPSSDRLRDRAVMVTGASGSIGGALCLEIAAAAPRRMVLVARQEAHLRSTCEALATTYPALEVVPLAADVSDAARLQAIFAQQAPQVIFHAAANKHVPVIEEAPSQAVLVNVFGTRLLAELAHAHGAETFVMISSDRAIQPTSLLGASKRVAEMLVEELAVRSATRFLVVRLGNVLGSKGSVLSIFMRQAAAGGPLTLTHPDSQRYFLTLREAVHLILSGAAMGEAGDVFMCDMGEPVRIQELAHRLLSRQGLMLGRDVALAIVGLRPGEKILEEKLSAAGALSPTPHPKLFKVHPLPPDRYWLGQALDTLEVAARRDDKPALRSLLFGLVAAQMPAVDLRSAAGE